ncbi:AraC family transcriptional regulator [Sebaldella sp. S0638]|uniref:AraC family transcriptional regulator n=1 Tax=Sebaldella sp. S0638 TaxID=2957809 RepID=UPI00209ECC70|nr:AraC family transcriptional regulator [Sebaldella sp. S0638]MCP1226497.1 AraC family transcriptional regulator [Sebaldella sp. S0638]
MKYVNSIKFRNGSKEELLSDLTPDFPYIASYVELDKHTGRFVPWHWHKEVELFYIKSGVLEYYTPKKKIVFPAGSGGIINSNVLHMTKTQDNVNNTVQLVHIFDTSFIGGQSGSKIEQKYITPLITAPQIEALAFYPDTPEHTELLGLISRSFELEDSSYAYEITLRSVLSEIWTRLFSLSKPLLEEKESYDKTNDELKMMMIYIYEHYMEKISIQEIANYAFISERKCFRIFHERLHTTPIEYIKNYRLQIACSMLIKSQETISAVGHACGLGSSSYFGKVFKEHFGCSPAEYRIKWQNIDT